MSKNEKYDYIKAYDLLEMNKTLPKGSYFYTYKSLSTVRTILRPDGGNFFFLNPISKMNDPAETALHGEESERIFALCFCQSDTENIPLWYLYGGITGEGAAIRLTAAKMRTFIAEIKNVYPVRYNRSTRKNEVDEKNPFVPPDYEMQCGWVYYYKGVPGKDEFDDNTYDSNFKPIKIEYPEIFYKNKTYTIIDSLNTFWKDNYFLKNYPWNYENEFRIVFKFKEIPKNVEMIAIKFDRTQLLKQDGLAVFLAPDISTDKKCEEIEKELRMRENRISQRKSVRRSKLDINLNLLNRNRSVIMGHLPELLKDLDDEEYGTFSRKVREYLGKEDKKRNDENPVKKKVPVKEKEFAHV